MANILLLLILTANIVLLTLILVAITSVKRVYRDIKAYITPESEGKLSPLAQTVDAMSSIFARSIVAQAKTTLMGLESGIKRGEKAIQGDIAVDTISNAGGLLGLAAQFPSVAKHLRRNPGLASAALQVLSQMGKQPVANSGANGSNHQSSLDLMSIK